MGSEARAFFPNFQFFDHNFGLIRQNLLILRLLWSARHRLPYLLCGMRGIIRGVCVREKNTTKWPNFQLFGHNFGLIRQNLLILHLLWSARHGLPYLQCGMWGIIRGLCLSGEMISNWANFRVFGHNFTLMGQNLFILVSSSSDTIVIVEHRCYIATNHSYVLHLLYCSNFLVPTVDVLLWLCK
jgi:hypothetical protein